MEENRGSRTSGKDDTGVRGEADGVAYASRATPAEPLTNGGLGGTGRQIFNQNLKLPWEGGVE